METHQLETPVETCVRMVRREVAWPACELLSEARCQQATAGSGRHWPLPSRCSAE